MTLKLAASQTHVHPSQRMESPFREADLPSKAHCVQPRNTTCMHMACPAHYPEIYAVMAAQHRGEGW